VTSGAHKNLKMMGNLDEVQKKLGELESTHVIEVPPQIIEFENYHHSNHTPYEGYSTQSIMMNLRNSSPPTA